MNDPNGYGPSTDDCRHPARRYESLRLSEAASAPYAMYRILCLFPWLVSEWLPDDYYKRLWSFKVEHKETRFEFELTEYQGGLRAYVILFISYLLFFLVFRFKLILASVPCFSTLSSGVSSMFASLPTCQCSAYRFAESGTSSLQIVSSSSRLFPDVHLCLTL